MKHFITFLLLLTCTPSALMSQIAWDADGLIVDGKRQVPVMGEIHYSRVPAQDWAEEIRKMKQGGVTIIATYVFWNHHEEVRREWDWTGQRNLRLFLETCKEQGMPVVLRIGPFAHGEARLGGIPDWVYDQGPAKEVRTEAEWFLSLVEELYAEIAQQCTGLLYKDGGPIIGAQFDNEYRGHGSYLMALKRIAQTQGLVLPFYTRTGWPALASPVPFGEMIPLYGDYADGFWDRSTKEGTGSYKNAFRFRASPEAATGLGAQSDGMPDDEQPEAALPANQLQAYPYFTCELGGGMITSYHRRVYMYPEDALAMAIVKLGSGSNLLGYYMYHGGTNPDGRLTYLNEQQATRATNWNDLPVKSYEFQAPLTEYGRKNPHFFTLGRLHRFLSEYGEKLAPMKPTFNADRLRWAYRENDGEAYVFFCNYARFEDLPAIEQWQFTVGSRTFPQQPITIPGGSMGVMPVGLRLGSVTLDYATAQPLLSFGNNLHFVALPGIEAEFCVDGTVHRVGQTADQTQTYAFEHGGVRFWLWNETDANSLCRLYDAQDLAPKDTIGLKLRKTKDAKGLRTIRLGVNQAAEQPSDEEYDLFADEYLITLGEQERGLIEITYGGDCARLYVADRLVADNFQNGRPFQFDTSRLPEGTRQLTLKVMPRQDDAPIYYPREANAVAGQAPKARLVKDSK